jgi:hypothetical protein
LLASYIQICAYNMAQATIRCVLVMAALLVTIQGIAAAGV